MMLLTEATIKTSRVMLWTETTIGRKTGVNNHEDGYSYREFSMAWCLLMTPSRALSQKDTTGAIFVVRQMQEKCLAVNKHIYMAFLVLE